MSQEIQNSFQRDPKHYYDDGNIDVCVGDTHFRLHVSVLRLSSGFFNKLLSDDWASTDHPDPFMTSSCQHGKVVCEHVTALVNFPNEEPSDFRALFSMFYNVGGESKIEIQNVEQILKLATEYSVLGVIKDCQQFLHENIGEYPVSAMLLAERYHYPSLYRKASALVISFYNDYSVKAKFKQLSMETQFKLQKMRLDFLEGFYKLSELNTWHTEVCNDCREKICKIKLRTDTIIALDELVELGGECSQVCSQRKMELIKDIFKLPEPITFEGDNYYQSIELPDDTAEDNALEDDTFGDDKFEDNISEC